MFFLLLAIVALVSLAISAIRQEPLRALAACRFSLLPALFVAIALRLLMLPDALRQLLLVQPIPGWIALGGILYLSSLLLLVVFTWQNRHLPGLTLIFVGLGLNFLAIALNGGQMPGDPAALASAGWLDQRIVEQETGRWSSFTILTEDSRVPWLTDLHVVPVPFRRPLVLSVGDFIIAAGALFFFNQLRLPSLRRIAPRLSR